VLLLDDAEVLPLLLQRRQHAAQPGHDVGLLEDGVAHGELEVAEGGGQVGEARGVAQVHPQDARHLVGDPLHARGHADHGGEDLLDERVGLLGGRGGLLHRVRDGRVEAVLQPHVREADAAQPLEGGLDGPAGEVEPVQDAHRGGDLLQLPGVQREPVVGGGDHRHHQVVLRVAGERLHVGSEPDLERRGTAGEDDGAADGEDRDALGERRPGLR
jgi:hypothetical protein